MSDTKIDQEIQKLRKATVGCEQYRKEGTYRHCKFFDGIVKYDQNGTKLFLCIEEFIKSEGKRKPKFREYCGKKKNTFVK